MKANHRLEEDPAFVPASPWKHLSHVRSGSFLELSLSELGCANILLPQVALRLAGGKDTSWERVCAGDDMDEQCLRLRPVGDVVVLHGFGMMARKSVTRMRGLRTMLVLLAPYHCRSEEAEKR